jgi:DNA-binding CsgD family transcriptional regulator
LSRVILPPDNLLDLIYDAATEPELWVPALVKIADMTKGVGSHIFGADSRPGTDNKERTVTFSFLGRIDEDVFQIFSDRHVISDLSAVMDNSPPGKFVRSDEIIPLSALKKTALFDEVWNPLDISHTAMVSLAAKKDFRVGLVISRSERAGPFEADAIRLFAQLHPHIRRSLGLGFRLEGYKALQEAQFGVLDRLSTGMILLDRRLRVLYANSAARLLASTDDVLVLQNSGVVLSPVAANRQLAALIRQAQLGAPLGTMSAPCADGRLLALIVTAVRAKDYARFSDANLPDATVLLFIVDPANRNGVPAEWITEAFNLTLAEAKVALAIASGLTISEYASRLGISTNTVKTHLRRVFDKTGTSRQSELARLMASIGFVNGKAP